MPERTPEAFDTLLTDCRRWLAATTLLPDEGARAELGAQLEAVWAQRERLRAPLQVVLVGGTGVGKSTLLNALAGQAIAAAGEVRPTTQVVTTYAHEANRLALPPELSAGRVVTHSRAELVDRVIVDTPDYDSQTRAHWALMEGALRSADVILWVTTAQKYANLADAGWLAQYHVGRRVVALLNRADEGVPPEVLADLRARLAAQGLAGTEVITLSALQASAGRPDPGFQRLVELLTAEFDAKQIRALKEENLAAAVRGWLGAAEAAVPADLEARLDDWHGAALADYQALCAETATRMSDKLAADPRLAAHVEYWHSFEVGGPVGLLLALGAGARALLSPRYPRLWQVGEKPPVDLAVGEEEAAALEARLLTWQDRHSARALDLGLEAAVRDWTRPDKGAVRAAAANLDDALASQLGRELRAAQELPQRALRVGAGLLNVLTVLVLVGLPGWVVIGNWRAWLAQQPVYALPWGTVGWTLVGWLVLVAWLARRLVLARTRGFLGRLRQMVGVGVAEGLSRPLLGRLEPRLAALRESRRALAELRGRALG